MTDALDFLCYRPQCPPAELPTSIIRRLPIRLTYDDNNFEDCYQGIPKEEVDFFDEKESWLKKAQSQRDKLPLAK